MLLFIYSLSNQFILLDFKYSITFFHKKDTCSSIYSKKYKEESSLVASWLELWAVTTVAEIPPLVWEMRITSVQGQKTRTKSKDDKSNWQFKRLEIGTVNVLVFIPAGIFLCSTHTNIDTYFLINGVTVFIVLQSSVFTQQFMDC